MDGDVRAYSEHFSYSPVHDCRMARISMVDKHNSEFFALVRAEPMGAAYRDARREALVAIDEAIERGCDPGEVRV
jgi:hypothetical protein